jgi:uncharacterized protein YegP (UPF0339 family)
MRLEIHRGQDGQWYIRLRAANGEIVLASEGYTRRWSARRAARRLQARFPAIEEIVEA